ncbi:pteridine transporter [Strigomonas culicis]|uniref:Pteridine transporter n=1 Tax=Strigomonas culicis TaxID=28005 RepID=S9UVM4_9TRYP|nr:pteridine transporter [Strigomonas culicis]|eukprot:EPY18551.1 pteridine transporter [Strigomonas culicis]
MPQPLHEAPVELSHVPDRVGSDALLNSTTYVYAAVASAAPAHPAAEEDEEDDKSLHTIQNAKSEADLIDEQYVHPEAARWFAAAPYLRRVPLFGRTTTTFGPRFTLALGMGYLLSKGAAGNIINLSRQPIMMNGYGIDAAEYQRLSSMYAMGWSVKAFVAVITDLFPCCGYTKRWYLTASAVMGSAFALAYALLPAQPSSANAAAAFIFLTCFSKANVDILSEGLYSRLMRRVPKVGPALVSWVWACTFAGTVVSASMMGPLSDAKLTYVGVLVSAGLQFVTVFFFAFNLYGEKRNRTERRKDALLEYRARVAEMEQRLLLQDRGETAGPASPDVRDPEHEPHPDPTEGLLPGNTVEPMREPRILSCAWCPFEVNAEVMTQHWRIVAYAVLMACAVITLAVVTIRGTVWARLYTCVVVTVVLSVGAFFTLPRVVAKAALFMLLSSIFYIQIPGALKNFYLASHACLPTGPNFSYTFYNTIAALITNVAGVAGSVLFTSFFSKNKFIYIFIVTTLLQMAGSIFDLIIVKRWNIDIGIPDRVMYVMGDAIIYEVCFVLSIMPQQILMSRLCPRGTESMSFAILAGLSSTGNSLSVVIGSLLMETVWPVRARTPCNFDNLPYLVVVSHLCVPILTVPAALLLLPNARVCDVLDQWGRPIHVGPARAPQRAGEGARVGQTDEEIPAAAVTGAAVSRETALENEPMESESAGGAAVYMGECCVDKGVKE